ncbi:uncharacterized protein LOC105926893 isoform X2 [Fundulus heteroclitus]|uniref:uncharacterized protein LOC105926893 isoform X2 n=1 Tax=Fundulus heteroclitus TaxID=8078 RepID=UPI00165BF3F2|nr:uncharacterized protein LOC105926893 isoform X2 [Fundulus heteroclitus]
MSSSQSLREFIRERLTAAAEEIFTEFDKTIVHYEEELDRQRRLLEICYKPQIKLQRIVLPQHYLWKEEEVPTDHHFCSLESNSSLDQEKPQPFCMKEEPVKPEPQQIKQDRAELEPPQIKKEQEEPEQPEIKTEQDELYTGLEKEQLEQQQSTDSFTVVPIYKETDHREPQSYKDQLIAQISSESEEQNQEGNSPEDSGSSTDEENKSFQEIKSDVQGVDDTEVERQETVRRNLEAFTHPVPSTHPAAITHLALSTHAVSTTHPVATSEFIGFTQSAIAVPMSESVNESGLLGLDKVYSLAEYLVELRNKTSPALNSQEVSSIIALWQNLLELDKERVVFAARHQDKLNTGRIRSPQKRQEFTPGDESEKQHALTTTAPSAQWPDCFRLVETIFVCLCNIHRCRPKKRGKCTFYRWDLILHDYRKIRQLILANGVVMQQTNLQLVDVSYTTLIQWHHKRVKRQETALVQQGLKLSSRFSVAADPLLLAYTCPHSLPSNTVGQAKLKRKLQFADVKNPSGQRQLLPAPPKRPQLVAIASIASQGSVIPTSQQEQSCWNFSTLAPHVPALAPAPAPKAASTHRGRALRKHNRKVLHNTCKNCGQFKIAETGHSQYKGQVYCPAGEVLTKEQWLVAIKNKK